MSSISTQPIRLQFRVSPGANRAVVVGRYGAAWKLRVTSAPEKGKANEEVVALLARTLGLGRTLVRIVSGHTRRNKLVELDGVTLAEAEARLEAACEADR